LRARNAQLSAAITFTRILRPYSNALWIQLFFSDIDVLSSAGCT